MSIYDQIPSLRAFRDGSPEVSTVEADVTTSSGDLITVPAAKPAAIARFATRSGGVALEYTGFDYFASLTGTDQIPHTD